MTMFVVTKRNGLGNGFKPGTYVECFDYGCQRCKIKTVNNRMQVIGHEGIAVPRSELEPFAMRILKRGLDYKG